MISGQPLWARLFYLIRTGHVQDALHEALHFQPAIEHREAGFVNHFRTWIESPERKRVCLLLHFCQLTALQIAEAPPRPPASYLQCSYVAFSYR
jgi:hypothetical protein